MIEKILERLETEKETANRTYETFKAKVDLGRTFGLEKAIEIVQEVAKEYDEFDVIYKKVCELEKRYDEDADVGNVNGCIRLENLLQCFKEELKAPYQKGE